MIVTADASKRVLYRNVERSDQGMEYQTPEASREANVAYHLVPTEVWSERGNAEEYVPEAYESDGFIHCTNGLETLVEVANMFYRQDDRAYKVLVLDVNRILSEVRYDDPDQKFPHIYGPLNTAAVVGELSADRAEDGTFLSFSSAS